MLAFSPDGTRLALGGESLIVLNSQTWTNELEIAPLPGEKQVTTLAWSPEGRLLAWARGNSGIIHLRNVGTGTTADLVGHRDWVLSLAFSPDNRLLASASGDQTVRVWNLARTNESCRFQGHLNEAWAVVFMPDSQTLVSGGKDGSVRFWNANKAPKSPGHWWVGSARQLVCARDSQKVIAVGPNGCVSVWDTLLSPTTEPLPALGSNNVRIALSPDGRWLATGDAAGKIRIWEWPALRPVTNLDAKLPVLGPLNFSAGGAFLWAGLLPESLFTREGGRGRGVSIWRTTSWEEVSIPGLRAPDLWYLDISHDDRWLATAHQDGMVRLWSLPDGGLVKALLGHSPWVERVAFSPTDSRLASAGWEDFVKVWDARDGRELMTLRGHYNHLTSIAFSPDGRRFAMVGFGPTPSAIKLWDPETQRELITLPSDETEKRPNGIRTFALNAAFSPDGNTLIWMTGQDPVHFWRAPTFAEIEQREKQQSERR